MNRRSLLAVFGLSPVVAVTAASANPSLPLVGERGPEAVLPGAGIDARGSFITNAEFRALLAENNARLRAELPAYIASQKQRGG